MHIAALLSRCAILFLDDSGRFNNPPCKQAQDGDRHSICFLRHRILSCSVEFHFKGHQSSPNISERIFNDPCTVGDRLI